MNEYELEEIKREIVESRALTIKTNMTAKIERPKYFIASPPKLG